MRRILKEINILFGQLNDILFVDWNNRFEVNLLETRGNSVRRIVHFRMIDHKYNYCVDDYRIVYKFGGRYFAGDIWSSLNQFIVDAQRKDTGV